MYAGLILAEAGLKPIIIERGQAVEQRTKDINEFFTKGKLLESSNVQFGEGGAGTFSDGKLTTRMKNVRVSKVYEEFENNWENICMQINDSIMKALDKPSLRIKVNNQCKTILHEYAEDCLRQTRIMLD